MIEEHMTQTETSTDNENTMPVEETVLQQETDNAAGIQPDTCEMANSDPEPAVEPLLILQSENADLKDKLLRVMAEIENTRRRAAKDVSDARAYGITGFARDMLTVVDNLQRAIEALPPEASQEENSLKGFSDGIDLTLRDLLNTLERHGVRKLDPKGERFDPHFHQAVFEMPDPTTPSGHIAVVIQPGFVINDRVLRPVMVGVSKGGGSTPAPDTTSETSS